MGTDSEPTGAATEPPPTPLVPPPFISDTPEDPDTPPADQAGEATEPTGAPEDNAPDNPEAESKEPEVAPQEPGPDEPSGDDPPDEPKSNYDKAIHQLNQRQSQDRQKLAELSEGITKITELLETRKQSPAPETPAEQEQADQQQEQVESDLDKILAEIEIKSDDDDLVYGSEMKQIVDKFKKAIAAQKGGAAQQQVDPDLVKRLETLEQSHQAEAQQREQAAYWGNFERDHGVTGGEAKYQEFYTEALDILGGDSSRAVDAASVMLKKWVETEKANAAKPGKTQDPPPLPDSKPRANQPKPGTHPPESTAGTQTTPPGASTQPADVKIKGAKQYGDQIVFDAPSI